MMKIKNDDIKFLLKLFLFSLILFCQAGRLIHAEAIRTVANGGLTSFSQHGTLIDWLAPSFKLGYTNIGFTINLFGTNTSAMWMRPQGYISPVHSNYSWEYTDYYTANVTPTLSPFEGEWDTAPNPAPYGTAVINDRPAFVMSWLNIGGQSENSNRGSFQLVLIDRSDTGNGNFDMEFNYGSINLRSYRSNKAFIGYTSGNGDGVKWKLPGSGIENQFRDADPKAIYRYRNTDPDKALTGRLVFESRNGVMSTPTYTTANYILPTTVTINITAANTVTLFSLGQLNVSTKNLLIQTSAYTPARNETFRLLNYGSGQFSNITLPPLGNGASWDLSELYTKGTFKVIKSPDKLSLFRP